MIGYGVKREKLYYLDLESTTSSELQQALAVESYGTPKKKAEIWLWHWHLEHASFMMYKILLCKFYCLQAQESLYRKWFSTPPRSISQGIRSAIEFLKRKHKIIKILKRSRKVKECIVEK